MKLIPTSIPGSYEVIPFIHNDERGAFVKTYLEEVFAAQGLETHWEEDFYSFSRHKVLRGMHFQSPPRENAKLVYAVAGKVLDVIVDLRMGSPVYGKVEKLELSDENRKMVYVPPGVAHGFYVLSPTAILCYKSSRSYSTKHDHGIRWDSIGFSWPDNDPVVSERDQSFPRFSDFKSPFRFKK